MPCDNLSERVLMTDREFDEGKKERGKGRKSLGEFERRAWVTFIEDADWM